MTTSEPMRPPILGRKREQEAMDGFLDALASAPVALVLEGEAGIGKTVLMLHLADQARRRGYRVLAARPAEAEQNLSYGALADLLHDVFEEVRPALPAPQRHALAAALLEDEPDAPIQPRTTASALVSTVAQLARTAPVLLLVDDVQWLDSGTEGALAFFARRLPERTGVAVSWRGSGADQAPLGLARASRMERLVRLTPRPLSLAGLHHLVRDRLGITLPRPILLRLGSTSRGNPLLALELARAWRQDPGTASPATAHLATAGIVGLVQRRLELLSAPALELVSVASVTPRPTRSKLASVLGTDDISPLLVELETAGLLECQGEACRFNHPVLAAAVDASLTPERRRRFHSVLAGLADGQEERARHLSAAAIGPDFGTSAALEEAARLASLRGAQLTAAELFAESVRLTPADDHAAGVRRMTAEASARLAIGDVHAARRLAEEVAGHPATPGDHAAALLVLSDLAWADGTLAATIRRLKTALSDSHLEGAARTALEVRLAALNVVLDPGEAVRHARRVARRIDAEHDPGRLAYVLFNQFLAEVAAGGSVRRSVFERALRLEAAGKPHVLSSIPLIWFNATDQVDAARARQAMENAWYSERGEDGWRADRLAHLGLAELRAGRWDLAEQHVEGACETLEELESPAAWPVPFIWRALVDAHFGRLERARATLDPILDGPSATPNLQWTAFALSVLGFVEFAAGNLVEADAVVTRMREHFASLGWREPLADRSEPYHVEALVALGEMDRARAVLATLEERHRRLPRAWTRIGLPRARALVLAGAGDLTEALGILARIDPRAASVLPFEHAWTLLAKGRLERRAKRKAAAKATLGRALETFERLGAVAWARQTRMELDRVGLRQRPRELSASEMAIARLLASGMTNREAAAAAFVSPKTVAANLARIYGKLGIRSRAELGAWLAGQSSGQT